MIFQSKPTHHPPLPAVLWTILALAFASLPHLAAMPMLLAGVILSILAWRAVAGWRRWPALSAWLRVLLTLALVALVVVLHGALWGRRLATAMLCVMLAAKMMEMYRVRDLRLVASVSFFLIASQFLFNERLVFLGYLIVGCWLSTAALVQIQQVTERNTQQTPRPSHEPVENLRNALKLLALAMPVALVLFLLFPRLSEPLWGMSEAAMDARTGLSDSMSPGSIAELFIDDSPAFRVEFDDGRPPPPDQLYWRGPVLWQFDGSTWRRAFFSDQDAPEQAPITANSLRYRVQLEPHERRWLLALDYPVRSSRPESRVTIDHQLVARIPVTTLSQYEVISSPDFSDRQLNPGQRLLATNLPRDRNPRTQQLAAELRERHPEDRELINAVLRWFREDEFEYNLMTSPLGRHGADEFLFDLKSGYCEYYASAFAVLMRAAGIPTRVVTGYQGGFWSEAGQYLLVRQSDAHAWNEVWLEDSGWVRVDPTAAVSPLRIRDGARGLVESGRFMVDSDWIRSLRNHYDRVQRAWNQWVLAFDADRQQRLLKRLGLPGLDAPSIGFLMLIGLLLALLPLAMILLRRPHPASRGAYEKAWRSVLRRLSRLGLGRKPHQTPLEFAQWISGQLTQGDADELVQLALRFSQLHYGPNAAQLEAPFIERCNRFRPSGTAGSNWRSKWIATRTGIVT
jgi:protein-glutamine gamma-glutamyltransferase